MVETILIFCLGVCVGVVGTAIYITENIRQFWREATLGMTDFDVKCINEEYSHRKSKGRESNEQL